MVAPYRYAFARAFLEVAGPHDGPACVIGEHAPTCLRLVLEGEVGEACETAEHVAALGASWTVASRRHLGRTCTPNVSGADVAIENWAAPGELAPVLAPISADPA